MTLLFGGLLAFGLPTHALGESLTEAELRVVDQRIEQKADFGATLTIAEGDTVFIEHSKTVSRARVRGRPGNYEALVTGLVAPPGVVVHQRIDEFRTEPRGKKVKVIFRYVIHVEPGTKSGGNVRLTLNLMERKGLANVVAKVEVKHTIKVGTASPSAKDLRADFAGYRHYAALTNKRLAALHKAGLRSISIKDESPIPSLAKASDKVANYVGELVRTRRRMWIAHRHLISALNSSDPQAAEHARAYVDNLDKPEAAVAGLPAVSLLGGKAESAAAPSKEAEAEVIKPTAVESAEVTGPSGASGTLAPVATYSPNTEGDPIEDLPESARPRPEKPPEPPKPPTGPVVASNQTTQAQATPDEPLMLSDDPFAARRVRKQILIPGYPRGLILDDPNIAHGGSVRMSIAGVDVRETAFTSSLFVFGQAALTPSVGIEVTVPIEYVDVDVTRARSVLAMGNPLVAAKYRLFLPEVEGRRPALTIRARWSIPFAPLHSVPPTSLGAEEFTREANFTDPYAFFLEKSDIGLGVSGAWQYNIIQFGVQMYGDYFIPVKQSRDRAEFFSMSYGASVGALPFGDIVGFYLEGRATTLLFGPRRTELFTYAGARGRFLDMLEPALWVALPVGSINNVSSIQVGAELRFSYDVDEVLDAGTLIRKDQELLQ